MHNYTSSVTKRAATFMTIGLSLWGSLCQSIMARRQLSAISASAASDRRLREDFRDWKSGPLFGSSLTCAFTGPAFCPVVIVRKIFA